MLAVPILSGVFLLGFVVTLVMALSDKDKARRKRTVFFNIAFLLAALVAARYGFPRIYNELVFQGLVLRLYIFASLLCFIGAIAIPLLLMQRSNTALKVVYGLLGFALGLGIYLGTDGYTQYLAAQAYKPTPRASLVPASKENLRFTPLQVAHVSMDGKVSQSQLKVDLDYTDPIRFRDGTFGYASPLVPDGAINTFIGTVQGFKLFRDTAAVTDGKRVDEVKQEFVFGEGMEYTDDVLYRLYQRDPYCKYSDIHYLEMEDGSFVLAAPKIDYHFQLPFFWIPEWGGVTLVYGDGTITDIPVAEIKNYPELKDQWVFPASLARYYVEVQRFDVGPLSGYYKREGKIQVPRLPGDNQMPFYTIADDGKGYHVVSTEPDGQSFSILNMYYIDTYTGEFTVFHYGKEVGEAIGPARAASYVRNIPGYKWVESTGSGNEVGNFLVIEPTYFTNDGLLFWKYTITPKEYTGVSATVVVDPRSEETLPYKTRAEFNHWLLGTPAPDNSDFGRLKQAVNALEEYILEAQAALGAVKAELSALDAPEPPAE